MASEGIREHDLHSPSSLRRVTSRNQHLHILPIRGINTHRNSLDDNAGSTCYPEGRIDSLQGTLPLDGPSGATPSTEQNRGRVPREGEQQRTMGGFLTFSGTEQNRHT